MKRALFFLFLAASSLCSQEPQVPRPATDFGIQTAPDKYIWLSQFRGKTVIVAIILTTCPHCQFTTGILNRIQKDYGARGVQVLASAIEPMSGLHIDDFRKALAPPFPVGYNEESYAAKFLGRPEGDPMLMPQLAFVDTKGVIRAQFAGDAPGLKNEIQEKTLRDALEMTIKAGQAGGK